MTAIKEQIFTETKKIITEKGLDCPEIKLDSRFLLDLPMDSLDLATLIVTLEMSLELDPFSQGFKIFHTVEQLIELYEQA
jgi:acyl carrier protein